VRGSTAMTRRSWQADSQGEGLLHQDGAEGRNSHGLRRHRLGAGRGGSGGRRQRDGLVGWARQQDSKTDQTLHHNKHLTADPYIMNIIHVERGICEPPCGATGSAHGPENTREQDRFIRQIDRQTCGWADLLDQHPDSPYDPLRCSASSSSSSSSSYNSSFPSSSPPRNSL